MALSLAQTAVSYTHLLTPLAGLPSTGAIYWVSVNNSGEKLIGGQNGSSAYAALVSPDGQLTSVAELPAGTIYSVRINRSGKGIIGGTASTLPYAALIAPDGTAITVPDLPTTPGIIYSCLLYTSHPSRGLLRDDPRTSIRRWS